ncbi:hypothetical protein CEXT_80411 [Caerostris extrusa]|uniref:Uncharacterized protein n=1 Tax=Caerostris extrusa TaxID=172846 RepID=A0AAV4TQA1_CAEEX|nr:hypothetical protein CEXT_80411 [Caerostris extrusa]
MLTPRPKNHCLLPPTKTTSHGLMNERRKFWKYSFRVEAPQLHSYDFNHHCGNAKFRHIKDESFVSLHLIQKEPPLSLLSYRPELRKKRIKRKQPVVLIELGNCPHGYVFDGSDEKGIPGMFNFPLLEDIVLPFPSPDLWHATSRYGTT